MNSEVGFGKKVLEVLESHDISFEHLPSRGHLKTATQYSKEAQTSALMSVPLHCQYTQYSMWHIDKKIPAFRREFENLL